jgi:hypothetical protein
MSVVLQDEVVRVGWSDAERTRALKRIIPKATIEKVLQRTRGSLRYCRRLPRCFVVWFIIAMGLFCSDSYRQVFLWLHRFKKGMTPGRTTLCEARKSIGVAPIRMLANEVIELNATPETPHAFYKGMRLMAIDGFVVDVPDTEQNDRAFDKPGSGRGKGAFPQVRVLSLCELGTHVLWKSIIQPCCRGEVPMAHYLMQHLESDMLVLWDRNFLSFKLVNELRQQEANLLARIKNVTIFNPIQRLSDGSYLAKFYPSPRHREKDQDGILVRIIEYTFDDPQRPGTQQKHRLLTTLLNHREHPVKKLIVLYHERWEEEGTIDELKTHQRNRKVLRSETPSGVMQEIYSLLLGHYIIRKLMFNAADLAGIAPRELSFVNTLKILQSRLPEVPRTKNGLTRWYQDLLAEISEEKLEPRRDRVNPRAVKRKMSHWDKKRPKHLNFL